MVLAIPGLSYIVLAAEESAWDSTHDFEASKGVPGRVMRRQGEMGRGDILVSRFVGWLPHDFLGPPRTS